MAEHIAPEEKAQSGRSVALGIFAFVGGLILLLALIKYFLG